MSQQIQAMESVDNNDKGPSQPKRPKKDEAKVEVFDFRPEELKVEVEGNAITVIGELNEHQGEAVHRYFERRVVIPEGIKKETIKLEFGDNAPHTQLKVDKKGMTYKVDVSGFDPGTLKVEVQGNEIVVRGEHYEGNQDNSVYRHFMRRVVIPEGIKKNSIDCELDEAGGRLCVSAERDDEVEPIPIVKK